MDLITFIVDFIFAVGLFINACLFIPQAYRLYKEKDSSEVSAITFGGFCLLQLSSIVYGTIHHDWILAIGYALSLLTCGFTTILIFRYKYTKETN